MYKYFDFSKFAYLGKLIYVQKSRNKQIFTDPCKNRERKLNYVHNFGTGRSDKPTQDTVESQLFAARFHDQFLQNITSKSIPVLFYYCYTVPPKSLFLLFCKCAKNAQRHYTTLKQRPSIKTALKN